MDLQSLIIPILADVTGFAQGMSKVGKDVMKVGAGLTIAAVPVAAFFKSSISSASDMSEQVGKSSQVFGTMSDDVNSWSSTMSTAFGISKLEALEYSGNFGNILSTMGLGEKQTKDYSTGLVELAADQAAFNNMPTEEVLSKINSGLTGQYKGLKSLGIVINETMVKEKALEMGLGDANGELDNAALAQARYTLIVEQSGNAMGQFQRESGGLAAQAKINQAEFANLKATLGAELLPVVIQLTKKIGEILKWFTALSPKTKKIIVGMGLLFVALGSVITVVGTLITVGSALATFLGGAGLASVLTFMAPFLPWIALVAGIIAIVMLMVKAWKNDFGGVKTWLTAAIGNIISWFKKLWTNIKRVADFIGGRLVSAFNRIKNAIGRVISKIRSLISWFSQLSIPSWLTPGSPTPLELGLKGINKQLDLAGRSILPKYAAELDMATNMSFNQENDNSNNDKMIAAIRDNKESFDYDKLARVFRDVVLREMV